MNPALAAAARRHLGTKFEHIGRIPGKSLDCVGLVVCSLRDIGYEVDDCDDYARSSPNGQTLLEYFQKRCVQVADRASADLVMFWIRRRNVPQHVGILSEVGVIHTWSDVDKVVEQEMEHSWLSRVHSYWKVRE